MVLYPLEFIHFWRDSLINNLKADELYNLRKDPVEENNIKKHNPEIVESLRRKLYTSEEFTSYIVLRAGKLKAKVREKLTEEEIRKLKSLGYL